MLMMVLVLDLYFLIHRIEDPTCIWHLPEVHQQVRAFCH